MNNITLEEIAIRIKEAKRIILLSHSSPDGDTVGSVQGLAIALEMLEKKVICVCDSDVPEYLNFIIYKNYVHSCNTKDSLIISVDVASPQMLGKLEEEFASIVDIRIDHHATGTEFAKFNYCDSYAAATAEIIYDLLIEYLDVMSPEIATALYTAISTDTGSFKYSNTTSYTHYVAYDLISSGADSEKVCDRLYENITVESIRSNVLFLDLMETYFGGKVLIVPITESDRQKYKLSDDQLDGISSLAKKIMGVELGISLREKSDGVYKVSMRSRQTVDCAELCAKFGGGGHVRASGATINAATIGAAKIALLETIKNTGLFGDIYND